MTSKPAKSVRWRRILIWVLAIFLILFAGIPTGSVLYARHQIISALRSATGVRLEEFNGDKLLTARTLVAADFHEVADSIPLTAQVGMPGMIMFCFVPHHRVVITDAAQRATTFKVCFGCEQILVSDGGGKGGRGPGILPTPFNWQQPLRRLFLRHDIPIRNPYPTDSGFEKE